jgi:predicted ATPase
LIERDANRRAQSFLSARSIADRGVELSRQHQFRQWEAMNRIVSGWCLAQQGEPTKAAAMIDCALTQHEHTGAQTLRPYFLLLLAETQALGGALAAARKTVDQAIECADQHGEQTWTAEILRTKGEIVLQDDPRSTAQAEALFRSAIETARRQGALSFELRAWINLGTLLFRLSDFNQQEISLTRNLDGLVLLLRSEPSPEAGQLYYQVQHTYQVPSFPVQCP